MKISFFPFNIYFAIAFKGLQREINNYFVNWYSERERKGKECSQEEKVQNDKRIAWKFIKTVILLGLAGYELIITNSAYGLVGYIYISSYPASSRRITVKYYMWEMVWGLICSKFSEFLSLCTVIWFAQVSWGMPRWAYPYLGGSEIFRF